jgi:hypothetical protein
MTPGNRVLGREVGGKGEHTVFSDEAHHYRISSQNRTKTKARSSGEDKSS